MKSKHKKKANDVHTQECTKIELVVCVVAGGFHRERTNRDSGRKLIR